MDAIQSGMQRGHISSMITDAIDALKRVMTYNGTTNATGDYSVVYVDAFSRPPKVIPTLSAPAASGVSVRLVSSTTTGFAVKTEQFASASVLGVDVLTTTVTNSPSKGVDIVVVEA